MSYTEMFLVPPAGELRSYREFRNSHGGAMRIWNAVWTRYVDPTVDMVPIFRGEGELSKLWRLGDDLNIPRHVRLVHRSTFDWMMAEHAHLAELAEAFRRFDVDLPVPVGRVNSIPAQAMALEELSRLPAGECAGVAWNQTSVNGDAWHVKSDERDEDGYPMYRLYDLARDQGHSWLFASTL